MFLRIINFRKWCKKYQTRLKDKINLAPIACTWNVEIIYETQLENNGLWNAVINWLSIISLFSNNLK